MIQTKKFLFYTVALLMAIVLVGQACTKQEGEEETQSQSQQQEGVGEEETTQQGENQSVSQESEGTQGQEGEIETASGVQEFKITASQWKFEPSTITVKKGDTVKLMIESLDVKHGIAIPDFGVNEELVPGKTTEVTFIVNNTGTFSFSCSVVCGEGHKDMKGQIVVTE